MGSRAESTGPLLDETPISQGVDYDPSEAEWYTRNAFVIRILQLTLLNSELKLGEQLVVEIASEMCQQQGITELVDKHIQPTSINCWQ